MANKRYIRLTTEGMLWSDSVAELRDESTMGPSNTPMYSFHDLGGNLRCITQDEAEVITEKEYFVEILKGTEKFND